MRFLPPLRLFPFPAGHSHENFSLRDEHIGEGDAIVGERQLSNLVRVPGAARLYDREGSIALAVLHDVRDVDPGIGNGRDAGRCRNVGARSVLQGCIHNRDPFRAQPLRVQSRP